MGSINPRLQIDDKKLVSGYSRRYNPARDSLSLEINQIVLRYLHKMNGHRFEWNIQSTVLSQSLSSYDSSTFDVGLPNAFFLRLESSSQSTNPTNPPPYSAALYQQQHPFGSTAAIGGLFGATPNNYNMFAAGPVTNATPNNHSSTPLNTVTQSKGDSFVLRLMAFEMPSSVYATLVHFELYCVENGAHFAEIWKMKNPYGGQQQGFAHQQIQHLSSGFSQSKPFTLLLDHMTSSSSDGINIICTVNALQLTSYVQGQQMTFHSMYESCEGKSGFPVFLVWHINISDLNEVESISSDVFGGMFQCKLCQTTQGMELWIALCGMPKDAVRMTVKLEVSAKQHWNGTVIPITSQNITLMYGSAMKVVKDGNKVWDQLTSHTNKLSLICTATVVHKIDANNNLLPDVEVESTPKDADHRHKSDIGGAESKFIQSEKREFRWKISGEHFVEIMSALESEGQFMSDRFILWNHVWYISILASKRPRNAHAWTANQALGRDDLLQIHLNPLLPEQTSFDCRVSIEILQTGSHCSFYRRYRGANTRDTVSTQTFPRHFVEDAVHKFAGKKELDIVVEMEKISGVEEKKDQTQRNGFFLWFVGGVAIGLILMWQYLFEYERTRTAE